MTATAPKECPELPECKIVYDRDLGTALPLCGCRIRGPVFPID
jgi:hypothetical protein